MICTKCKQTTDVVNFCRYCAYEDADTFFCDSCMKHIKMNGYNDIINGTFVLSNLLSQYILGRDLNGEFNFFCQTHLEYMFGILYQRYMFEKKENVFIFNMIPSHLLYYNKHRNTIRFVEKIKAFCNKRLSKYEIIEIIQLGDGCSIFPSGFYLDSLPSNLNYLLYLLN